MAVTRAGHRVFISYSHGDMAAARALHSELSGLLRGVLWRPRLRVLRDETTMTPGADLPTRIQTMIDAADWLIVLLSPSSGRSPWVQQELQHWHAVPERRQQILVVTLDDTLSWRPGEGLVAPWLAPEIGAMFEAEPLFVAFRGDSATPELERRTAGVKLAAAVLGVPPEEVEGEERRLRRLRTRVVAAVVGSLAVLTIAAVVGGVLAVQARDRSQRSEVASLTAFLDSQALLEAPARPDLGAELAVAAWKVHGGRTEWGQLIETAGHLPSGFTALRLPFDKVYDAAPMLSPDGERIAVVGVREGGNADGAPDRLVIASLDGSADPVVVDAEEGQWFTRVTWLGDDRLVVLGSDESSSAEGSGVATLVTALGENLDSTSFSSTGEMEVNDAGEGRFLVAGDDDLLLYGTSASGSISPVWRVMLGDEFVRTYGVHLRVDASVDRYWATGGNFAETITGSLDHGGVQSWIGDRSHSGLPFNAGALWNVGDNVLVGSTYSTEEAVRSGGSLYLVERSAEGVATLDTIGLGEFPTGLCMTEDGDDRYLAAPASGERILQAHVTDGFASQTVEGLTAVVAVSCSTVGTTAWVTEDGVVLVNQGQLLGESGGLTWLRNPEQPPLDLGLPVAEASQLRESELHLSADGADLRESEGQATIALSDVGFRPNLVSDDDVRSVSTCLAVGPAAETEADSEGTWTALVGEETEADVRFEGVCRDWEVRAEGEELRVFHHGGATEVAGFQNVAVDESEGLLVADMGPELEFYATTDRGPVLVGRYDTPGSVIFRGLLLFEGGLLVIPVESFDMQSPAAQSNFAVLPVGPDAIASYFCNAYSTGSLAEFADSPQFPVDPSRLDDARCPSKE